MMRVLHVYKTYFPDNYGGVPEIIRQLCNGMKIHGIESEVFTLSKNPIQKKTKFEDHFVHNAKIDFELLSTPFSFESIKKFRLQAKDFDLIHYHYPNPFGDLLKLSSGLNQPSIVTYHSDIVRQKFSKYIYYPLEKYFLNSVEKIVCTSDKYKETSSVLKKYESKTLTISLGVSLNQSLINNEKYKNKWKNKLPKKFFLFLGVMRNYKGLDSLIEAAVSMQGNIVFCGDGPELQNLQNFADNNNMSNVYFTGKVDEVNKTALLDLCTGLVLPSHLRSEAFGLVLLEAAMRSKPLISTELNTGTSYVNEHGKTGLVVPTNNPPALRAAMERILLNSTLVKEMGAAAKKRYKKYFTAEKMCAEYSDVYRKILEDFHNAPI